MTTSAPGKLMLMGEHAVVYGYPSLVTAIDQRLFVSETGEQAPDTRFLDAAIAAWGKPGTKLFAKSTFSGKYGFGSSAAVTVAALKYLRPTATAKEVFDEAFKIILQIQGVGSGFDVAAAAYGGTIYYIKNKTIEPLTSPPFPLVVGYTGVKADTVAIVKAIEVKKKKFPEKVERIFAGIAKLVDEGKGKMAEGDWQRVGTLMNFNQDYLRDLGVSSEKLEAMIAASKSAGAWGAKLSGAGMGDCMIALAPPEKEQAVEDAIAKVGGEVIHIHANAPGVRLETTDDQKELFIVVDRQDNVLGYKTRWECHHDKSLIHRTVGVLVENTQGQVLLQKRSMTKDMDAGLWGLAVAGHVRKGQSYEEAATREMQEELGVTSPLTPVTRFISEDSDETEMAMLYKAVADGPFAINHDETDEVRFFAPRELRLRVASGAVKLAGGSLQSLKEAHIL